MEITKDTLHLPALLEYRAQQVHRRAVAFCDAPEYVLGTRVLPLTPRTFSMLYAVRSAFLFGGPQLEQDIRTFVWFHSPLYCHAGGWFPRLRKRVALARLSLALNQPWRRALGLEWTVNHYLGGVAIAKSEVKQIIDDAFADAPAKSARSGKSIASLEGFFTHEFAVAYGWTPERTRNTPLRQLVQLHRCIRTARGEDVSDEGEAKILANHLLAKNAALKAERDARAAENK